MTDAGWQAIATMVGSVVTGIIAWSARTKAQAAQKVGEDVREKTEQQTVTIGEIDRKADQAVAQNDGRLSKLETQLLSVNAELAAAKTQNATLLHVIERLNVKDAPPTPPLVLAPVQIPATSAEGGRRQGDLAPKKESP